MILQSQRKSRSGILQSSIAILISGSLSLAGAQSVHPDHPPKREVRAVWITTVNGLDWPHSTDVAEQQASLRAMVGALSRARFNTIFFQVRGRGDAFYKSRFEPWAQLLTGTSGKDPGWDPLQFILNEAHLKGLEVHAWFNTFLIKSARSETPETTPRHIVLKHPEWLRSVDGEYWIDPGIPAARAYLEDVVLDLVGSYDLDGVQFDFIRYPVKSFSDEQTYSHYGGKTEKDEWRRDNITTFVREVYERIHRVKPMVKVGSAPIGIYRNFGSVRGLQSYSELFQDSRLWLREGIHDYLVPQVYWSLGDQTGDPDFAVIAKEWVSQQFRRQLYLGIGAYKPDVHKQLPELIDLARSLHADGVSFFRFENISDALSMGDRYETIANIPPMPWKDSIPPPPPARLRLAHGGRTDAGESVTLLWDPPPADSGDIAYYNVYRSTSRMVNTDDPGTILAIVPATSTSLTDTIRRPAAPGYYYAVSAFDRGNNESAATNPVGMTMPEVIAMAKEFELRDALSDCYHEPSSKVVYIPYELRVSSPVIVKVLDGSNSEVVGVVDAVQAAGSHVAAADLSKLAKGEYTVLLVAGGYTGRKPLHIDR